VKQTELEADADKVRRGKPPRPQATSRSSPPRRQEEAMKPRAAVQAEADRAAPSWKRRRQAVAHPHRRGTAQARRIEAAGEADSRLKAGGCRSLPAREKARQIASAQMERDGELLSKHRC